MVDLIPIGTVNRTAAENNAVKNSGNVQEAAKSEPVTADHKQKIDEPKRRFRRRQLERRVSARGARWNSSERRKNRDRRETASDDDTSLRRDSSNTKNSSRKGRFIDERV